MRNINLGSLAKVAMFSGVSAQIAARFPLVEYAIEQHLEKERLICEIAAITKLTTEEVEAFYRSHDYSLEYIKDAVLVCGKLEEIETALLKNLLSSSFEDAADRIERNNSYMGRES